MMKLLFFRDGSVVDLLVVYTCEKVLRQHKSALYCIFLLQLSAFFMKLFRYIQLNVPMWFDIASLYFNKKNWFSVGIERGICPKFSIKKFLLSIFLWSFQILNGSINKYFFLEKKMLVIC